MSALNKIKNVEKGLTCCDECHSCSKCPYKNAEGCHSQLGRDALEVINALRAELKKRTSKTPEEKSEFIVLTTGIVKESGGEPVWYNSRSVAVSMNDILLITDYEFGFSGTSCGSEVRLKTDPQTVILVQESIEEILGKIADAKGE